MSRSRVQVLTLAEIAFTMLFALIILSLPQITEGRRTNMELERLKRELEQARSDLAAASERIEKLEAEIRKKVSNIPPACSGEPIERFVVIGPNEFAIGDQSVDAAFIAVKHSDALRDAEKRPCRHRAVVSWLDTLAASDLDAALRRLERYFYIQRAGSVENP